MESIRVKTDKELIGTETELTNVILEFLYNAGYKSCPEVVWCSKWDIARPDITAIPLRECTLHDFLEVQPLIIEIKYDLSSIGYEKLQAQLNKYERIFGKYLLVLPESCKRTSDDFITRLLIALMKSGSMALLFISDEYPENCEIWVDYHAWRQKTFKIKLLNVLQITASILASAVAPDDYPSPPNKYYTGLTIDEIRNVLRRIQRCESPETVLGSVYSLYHVPTTLLTLSDMTVVKIFQEGGLKIPSKVRVSERTLKCIKEGAFWKLPSLATIINRNRRGNGILSTLKYKYITVGEKILPYGIHDYY